jgi:hypothetical protein
VNAIFRIRGKSACHSGKANAQGVIARAVSRFASPNSRFYDARTDA